MPSLKNITLLVLQVFKSEINLCQWRSSAPVDQGCAIFAAIDREIFINLNSLQSF